MKRIFTYRTDSIRNDYLTKTRAVAECISTDMHDTTGNNNLFKGCTVVKSKITNRMDRIWYDNISCTTQFNSGQHTVNDSKNWRT